MRQIYVADKYLKKNTQKQFDMDINEIHNNYLLILLKELIFISEE